MMFWTTSSPKHVIVLIQMQMRDEITQGRNTVTAAGLGLICGLR